MDEDTQTCPFCMIDMSGLATVCASCGAIKGHRMRNGMRSKGYVMAYSVLLGAVAAIIFFTLLVASPGTFLSWVMFLLTVLCAISGVAMFRYGSEEPRWYRKSS